MTIPPPAHFDEPRGFQGYADIISRVAKEHQAIVVRRDGNDIAAIIPIELLETLTDAIAREEAQRISRSLDWDQLVKANPPPQEWFDRDEPKPF